MEIYIVNAFSINQKGGSPTGVVLYGSYLSDRQKIHIVRKLKVSHVAFVGAIDTLKQLAEVRFFTSAGELANCGHGTIAVHALMLQKGLIGAGIVKQRLMGGIQTVKINNSKNSPVVHLKLSHIKITAPLKTALTKLYEAIGIQSTDVGSDIPAKIASAGNRRFLIRIFSKEKLKSIRPDYEKLQMVCREHKCIGVFVYYLNERKWLKEATARFFAPAIGVPEDIINGNSSGCLGQYLLMKFRINKIKLSVIQGEAFHSKGKVTVLSERLDSGYETWIGGTATIPVVQSGVKILIEDL